MVWFLILDTPKPLTFNIRAKTRRPIAIRLNFKYSIVCGLVYDEDLALIFAYHNELSPGNIIKVYLSSEYVCYLFVLDSN